MKRGPEDVAPYLNLFGRYLREQGLPVTQQRLAVAETIFSSSEHLSVEDLEQELRARKERIGKATIYRTLDLLVRSKLVQEHDFEEGFKRYEHRLSRQPEHHHLVCTESGEIIEFRHEGLDQIVNEVAAANGFRPTHCKLVILGLSQSSQAAGVEVPYDGLTCPIETA